MGRWMPIARNQFRAALQRCSSREGETRHGTATPKDKRLVMDSKASRTLTAVKGMARPWSYDHDDSGAVQGRSEHERKADDVWRIRMLILR